MALDISRMGDLSSIGLLADKVLLQLHYLQERPRLHDINTAIFQRASNYLACAIEGISRVDSLELSEGTVFAVDAYEAVSRAIVPPTTEDIEHTAHFVTILKSSCDQFASGNLDLDADNIAQMNLFFTRLSQYATEERSLILQSAASESLYRTAFRYA